MTFFVDEECGGQTTQDAKLIAYFAKKFFVREMGRALIWQQLGNENGKD